MDCKFSIGQKIVAIADHPGGCFVKDQEFSVLDLTPVCVSWGVKITEGSQPTWVMCTHGLPWKLKGVFFDQCYFAPVQEVGEMTFEEALSMVEPIKEIIEN